jgi:hypothetical protein
MGLSYDESRFPLVLITFEGTTSDSEWESFLRGLEATTARCFREEQRVGFVVDTTKGRPASAAQRRALADWMNAHDASSRATCAAFAFVIPNPVVRGALTAVLWLARMPAPHRVTATRAEAVEFARAQLSAAHPVGPRAGGQRS